MITAKVIAKFLADLGEKLEDFNLITPVKYSPDLEFSPTLRKETVKLDNDFLKAKGSKNWVGILWNRGPITPYQPNARKNVPMVRKPSLNPNKAEIYSERQGVVTINVAIVSNSMSHIETLEEHLYVHRPEETFEVSVLPEMADVDHVKATIQTYETQGVIKQNMEQFGTISIFQLTVEINYPVFVVMTTTQKIILYPELQIYME